MDKYDITGRPVLFEWSFLATQRSRSKMRSEDSQGPQNRMTSVAESFSCRSTVPNGGKITMANATEIDEHAKQFQLGHWCFCGLEQENYGIAGARTNLPLHGITLPPDGRHLKKRHIQYFLVLHFSGKENSSPSSNQTTHFQSSTQTKTVHLRRVDDWFDQYKRIQEARRDCQGRATRVVLRTLELRALTVVLRQPSEVNLKHRWSTAAR